VQNVGVKYLPVATDTLLVSEINRQLALLYTLFRVTQAGRVAGGRAGKRAGGQAGRRAGGQAGERAGGQVDRGQAGRWAGRATVAVPIFPLVGVHAFLFAVLPSIFMFFSQYTNILMEIFYLHLLTRVTSNKRVFQCTSNICHLRVATSTGKSCQIFLKKGVCDDEINFNITCL
jgi:hypothetical protein